MARFLIALLAILLIFGLVFGAPQENDYLEVDEIFEDVSGETTSPAAVSADEARVAGVKCPSDYVLVGKRCKKLIRG